MNISSKTMRIVFDYAMMTIGSLIAAIGIGVFLVKANVVPGGVTGISMAINFVWDGISVGTLILLLNIPLFIWGVLELGNAFGVRTLYGFVSNSLFIDLFRGEFFRDLPVFHGWALQNTDTINYMFKNDFFFFMAIGTVLIGIGLGIIFKFKGTTAGTEIICAIVKKRFGFKPGITMIVVDIFIITLATIVLYMQPQGEIPVFVLMFYALVSLYAQGIIFDQVVYGFDYAKNMLIVSSRSDEIAKFIMKELDRGVTAFYARGMYTNKDRDVLMTIVSQADARALTPKIREIDPSAFVVLSNVHEVLGEGFRTREEVDVKFIEQRRKAELEKVAAEAATKAIRAELAADQAMADAQQARQHAQRLLAQDADCSEKHTQEAHLHAERAEQAAQNAHEEARVARERAKMLEDIASSIESCVNIEDLQPDADEIDKV